MTLSNVIAHGDVLDVLTKTPDNTFDAGVTSPPYNKGKNRTGVLVSDIDYSDIDDSLEEGEYQDMQIAVLNELFRVMKKGGSLFYNHKLRWDDKVMTHPMQWLSKTKWAIKQEIVWDRNIAANIRGWRFWQVDERIYWLYKPRNEGDAGDELLSKHALLSSVWQIRPENHKETVSNHPAPFPIDIPLRCIYSLFDSAQKKLIIDPYMGSGTTAVACKMLGHDFYGIDISRTYIEQAYARTNNISEREVTDYLKEISLHTVKNPYNKRKARWDDGLQYYGGEWI